MAAKQPGAGDRKSKAAKSGKESLPYPIDHGQSRDAAGKAVGVSGSLVDRGAKAALLHPKGAGMSDSQIAEHVGVDDKTVGKYRAELVASSELPKIDTRTVKRGDQEYVIDTTNIGKSSACPNCGSTELDAPSQGCDSITTPLKTLPIGNAIRRAIEENLDERRGNPHGKVNSGQSTGIQNNPLKGEESREFAAKKAGLSSEPTAKKSSYDRLTFF